MDSQTAVKCLQTERNNLGKILNDFKPEDGNFRPTPEMFSVAQQIRHIANVTHWCCEGGFGKGFDMDFEKMQKEEAKPCTLAEALALLNKNYDDFIAILEKKSVAELNEPLPADSIFGPVPRFVVVSVNGEHTAHHRGALTVYVRLLGRKPSNVYG